MVWVASQQVVLPASVQLWCGVLWVAFLTLLLGAFLRTMAYSRWRILGPQLFHMRQLWWTLAPRYCLWTLWWFFNFMFMGYLLLPSAYCELPTLSCAFQTVHCQLLDSQLRQHYSREELRSTVRLKERRGADPMLGFVPTCPISMCMNA